MIAFVVGGAVSAFFLWLAVRRTHPQVVWDTVSGADPGEIVAAAGCMVVIYLLQSLRWRGLAHGSKPRRSYVRMVIAGVAVNNALPLRLGDWLRASWLARLEPMPAGRALATVVFDRCADVVTLVVFVAVAVPFSNRPTWLVRLILGGAALVVFVVLFLVAAQVIASLHSRVERQRSRLRRVARDLLDALAHPPGVRGTATALALSAAAWLVFAGGAWLAADSVGIRLSIQEALLLAGIVNLGVAIPSSPGFVGTYQWLTVSALAITGVDRDSALAVAVLLHASWYVPTTLAGGGLLVATGVRRKRGRGALGPLRVEPAADEGTQHS